jgi:hypothetical protein
LEYDGVGKYEKKYIYISAEVWKMSGKEHDNLPPKNYCASKKRESIQ